MPCCDTLLQHEDLHVFTVPPKQVKVESPPAQGGATAIAAAQKSQRDQKSFVANKLYSSNRVLSEEHSVPRGHSGRKDLRQDAVAARRTNFEANLFEATVSTHSGQQDLNNEDWASELKRHATGVWCLCGAVGGACIESAFDHAVRRRPLCG